MVQLDMFEMLEKGEDVMEFTEQKRIQIQAMARVRSSHNAVRSIEAQSIGRSSRGRDAANAWLQDFVEAYEKAIEVCVDTPVFWPELKAIEFDYERVKKKLENTAETASADA